MYGGDAISGSHVGSAVGVRVPVGVGLADRRNRPPERVVRLVAPDGDQRVGGGHVEHREEARVLLQRQPLLGRQRPEDAAPRGRWVLRPVAGRVRLVGAAGHAGQRSERLHLVQLAGVPLARQLERAVRAELRAALDQERPHVLEPGERVVHERGQNRPPLTPGADPIVKRNAPKRPSSVREAIIAAAAACADRDPARLRRAVWDPGE